MLEILRCSDPDEKRRRVGALNPATQTWVVSDLQSKWHLQKELLQQHGVLEQTTIVRATELWEKLGFQLLPDMHLLSRELAQTLFWNWIEPMNLPWAKSPQAVPVVLTQMQMWMSIFSDPTYEDIMNQWFADNQEAYVRWGHWFELCAKIWERCREQNLVMQNWMPAMLLSEDLSRLNWKKEMIFDLGPQISQVEGQLIKALGDHLKIKVIYPEAPWLALMPSTLRPYETLVDAPTAPKDWQPTPIETTEFGRFSTQLAETKDAVARVRAWLDAGVEPQKIAVVAPDIEEYWPSLNLYFRQEGIPVDKALSASLGGFLEMARWLAALRTAMAKVSSGDLEILLFTQAAEPRLPFDEFRILFSQIYDHADLGRARELFESSDAPRQREPLAMAEFLAWTLKFWPRDAETERLMQLLKVIGAEVPKSLNLLPPQWLSYLEGVLSRREKTIVDGAERGIWCVSLSSADWLPATHAIFLNLNEGALRSIDQSPVSAAEAQRIFTDTGYAVGTTDRQEREFEFLWFLQRRWSALRLCFSSTDFQGKVLTPSKLWMWSGFVTGKLKDKPESPLATRWDDLQRISVEELAVARQFPPEQAQGLATGLRRDVDIGVNTWGQIAETRLSASSLERYWKCPFIFAAERLLKQSDDPVLDLDLDRAKRGRLLHAILEALTEEPFKGEWSDDQLSGLVDTIRERENIRTGENRLWPAIRAQHVRLARQFLAFESEWRVRFPETKTVGREVAFEAFWSLADGAPTSTPGAFKLSGRLDRVDRDNQGRYALIDYKGSSQGTSNWESWVRNHSAQMPLYAMLLENGLTGLPEGEVHAANYYVVRDRTRRKGFHMRDAGAALFDSNEKHRNFITTDEKQQLFLDFARMTTEALTGIVQGKLNPNPEDKSLCSGCAWRSLCRAPHLN